VKVAAGAVTFGLRWKAACGYAIDVAGFHPTALAHWRRRLADSERPPRIFEVVREVITQTGAIEGTQRRALDSTILDDAVARQDTVTQLIAAIRRVRRHVAGATDLIAMHWSTMRLPCWTRSTSNCSPATRREAGRCGGRWRWSPDRCRARRGIRRHRRPVAHRPQDRAGQDHLDTRHAHKTRERKQDGYQAVSRSNPTPG
jgi:hypothetical protein